MQIGDVVRLKSGGLRMTVEALHGTLTRVVWLDLEGRPWDMMCPIGCFESAPSVVGIEVTPGTPVSR